MSGGFSVPFAALAVFASSKYGQVIWSILAFSAFMIMVYRVWAREATKVSELSVKLSPKIKLSFNSSWADCVISDAKVRRPIRGWPVVASTAPSIGIGFAGHIPIGSDSSTLYEPSTVILRGTYYRLRAETLNVIGPIEHCEANLISVIFNEEEQLSGAKIFITFCPAEEMDARDKRMLPGIIYNIDFLLIDDNDHIHIPSKNFLIASSLEDKIRNMFDKHGDYILTIEVASAMAPIEKQRILLKGSGDRDTAQITEYDPKYIL